MRNETVILLHGFGGNRLWMRYLASNLRAAGYETSVWSYPSLLFPIDRHGERFARFLDGLLEERGDDRPYHLVAHSMGNLVARDALARTCFPFRRWIMLAPPNRGSFVADRVAPVLGSLIRPLQQMRTCETSYVHGLTYPPGTEIGVIAASRDFVVADDSSVAPSMVDRITLPSTHAGLLIYSETARQIRAFLADGRFDRSAAARIVRRAA